MALKVQVLIVMALSVLCLVNTAALAQTTLHTRPAHNTQRYRARAVVVRIKNGPVIRGRLIEADTDSIRLEVEDIDCPITLDARDVASILFPPAEVAKKSLPKATRANSTQAKVREAPIPLHSKADRSQVGPRVNQGEHTARRRRVRARPAGATRNDLAWTSPHCRGWSATAVAISG